MSFFNKSFKSIAGLLFSSICNWWYQGELGFCCRLAEPCINVYGHVCHYVEVHSEPCASFREIKAISSKFTVCLLYFIYFLNFGEILAKTRVGLTSGTFARWGPGWFRLLQSCPVTSQNGDMVPECDIFQKTEFAKTTSSDGLRRLQGAQKCKHFFNMTFS